MRLMRARRQDSGQDAGSPRSSLARRRNRRAAALVCGIVFASIFALGFAPTALAANPDPVQYYYVPFTEDQLLDALDTVNAEAVTPVINHITLTAVANNTLVYYDQWENGYDIDTANPANLYSSTNTGGTQIWGDGNAANGLCPGTSDDLITAGMVIDLTNPAPTYVPVPRVPANIFYDGRDKIGATKTIAVTRTTWASGSGTLFAGSVEVYDLYAWGSDYRAPVGVDIPDADDYQMFEYTGLSVMAGMDGATVHIDADNSGTAEINQTLAEGETIWVTNVEAGAHVYTDDGLPVQVDIFTGDIGSNYESRDSALIPTGTWSSDYYTPVSTPIGTTQTTTVWLFNAGSSDITVNYKRWVAGVLTTTQISVTAGNYAKQLVTDGTGAEFYTDDGAPFYAYSTTDSNSGDSTGGGNQAWDWSFTLVPRDRLTTQLLVGLGIGRDPTSGVNLNENGNPIWVTPHVNDDTSYATVYVDYDGDRTTGPNTDGNGNQYDISYSLRNLERTKIYRTLPAIPVTVDANSTGSTTGATTLNVAHTAGATADLMLVSVNIGDDGDATTADVSSVTYGAQTMTRISSSAAGATRRTVVYGLANPAVGTANVTVTTSENVAFTAGVTTFIGADVSNGTTSALRAASATNGTTAAMTVAPASALGDLVYESVAARSAGALGTVTVDANSSNGTAGAATLNVSHTTGATANLMLVSVNIGDDGDATTADVSSVTYGAQTMTLVSSAAAGSTRRTVVYGLANPAAGTANVTVTTNETDVPYTAGATTFIGADVSNLLASALRIPSATTGTAAAMTVAPTSVAGDLVYESVAARSTLAGGTVTVGATTSTADNGNDCTNVNTVTVSHTTGATANLMLVSIALADNNGNAGLADVSSVTYGPVATRQTLTPVWSQANGTNTGTRAVIYALASPTTGSARDVIVTTNQNVDLTVGVTTFIGADLSSGLTSALGTTANGAAGTGSTMTATMASVAGDLVYEVVSIRDGTDGTNPNTPTATSGQSRLWTDVVNGGQRVRGAAGALTATGTSTSITETQTNGPFLWAMAGVSIHPAPPSLTTPAAFTTTSGQTRQWTNTGVGASFAVRGAAGTLTATGGTTTITETQANGPYPWAMVGVAIVPARAAATTPAAFTTTSGQTRLWTEIANTGAGAGIAVRGAAGTRAATGATTTITETQTNGPYPWAMVGVAIVPAQPPGRGDQSGMLIYTLDPDVKLAGAWGQDPLTATAGAPGLDVGTTIPPLPEFSPGKESDLAVDFDPPGDLEPDGYIGPEDILTYTITAFNTARLPVPDVIIRDTIPTGCDYIANTTYVTSSQNATPVQIPDNPTGAGATAFPLDDDGTYDGYMHPANIELNGWVTVTFQAQIKTYEALAALGMTQIRNGGSGAALGITLPVRDDAKLRGRIGDVVWNDEDQDGIQDAGESGVAGVTVRLLDSSLNPVLDDSGVAITQVTNSSGKYDFKGLYAGNYVVEFELPDSWNAEYTLANQGSDDTLDSDAVVTGDPDIARTASFALGAGQTDRTRDCGIRPPYPTLAVVSSFNASVVNGKVVLTWTTSSEVGTAGFYLERYDTKARKWQRVSKSLIPALLESSVGGSYSLADGGAKPNIALYYRLVEIEADGSQLIHGPFAVNAKKTSKDAGVLRAAARPQSAVRQPKSATAGKSTAAAQSSKPAVVTRTAGANLARIEVTAAGLYRIDTADIVATLGATEATAKDWIRTTALRLTNRDKAIPYFKAADDSAIYFYAEAIDSIYTSANVYWLSRGKALTMSELLAAASEPVTAPAPATTTTTGQAEEAPTTTSTTEEVTRSTGAMEDVGTTTTEPVGGIAAAESTTTTESTTTSETQVVVATNPEVPAITSFIDQAHYEQDVTNATGLFHDPAADFWFWTYMSAGDATIGTGSVEIDAPGALEGDTLAVTLYGSSSTGVNNEHHVQVWLNSGLLGDVYLTGVAEKKASFDIPDGLLKPGSNQVRFVALKDAGVPYSIVSVDSVDLVYERATEAVSDRLLVKAATDGLTAVSGLSGEDAWLLDVTDPRAPKVAALKGSVDASGKATVEFDAIAGRSYLVATSAGALRPRAVTGTVAPTLRDKSKSADYLVITSPDLATAAAKLAAYRQSQGMKTMVVTTAEIYDTFNYGIADPNSIKSFISFATGLWKGKPKYVVLAGEGSYDYKNVTGSGDSLVPTLLVDSDSGLVASDATLADVKGKDGIPDIAVGRIPARTAAEFDAVVAKIKVYEADTTGAWHKKVVLAADNADQGGDFATSSETLASMLPSSLTVTRAYIGSQGLAAARSAVLQGLSDGALLLNYTGHGAVDRLAQEGLLTKADIAALPSRGPGLPLVTALTCVASNYAIPGWDSVGEALVKRDKAGAIAVWSAAGLESNSASVQLGKAMMEQLFSKSGQVLLGDVTRAAASKSVSQGLPASVLLTYNLLGDPALRLQR